MFCGFPVTSTTCLHGGLASFLPAALPWTPPLPFLVPPSGPSPNHSSLNVTAQKDFVKSPMMKEFKDLHGGEETVYNIQLFDYSPAPWTFTLLISSFSEKFIGVNISTTLRGFQFEKTRSAEKFARYVHLSAMPEETGRVNQGSPGVGVQVVVTYSTSILGTELRSKSSNYNNYKQELTNSEKVIQYLSYLGIFKGKCIAKFWRDRVIFFQTMTHSNQNFPSYPLFKYIPTPPPYLLLYFSSDTGYRSAK
ncbi:hypothetical protein STEG23_030878, partial [Scotinomys teguina]